MMASSETETGILLTARIQRARIKVELARIEYERILEELAHRSPSSREIDRLAEASRREIIARHQLWDALARLDEFTHGFATPSQTAPLEART